MRVLVLLVEHCCGYKSNPDNLCVAEVITSPNNEVVLLSFMNKKTDRFHVSNKRYPLWFTILQLRFINIWLCFRRQGPNVFLKFVALLNTDSGTIRSDN